MDQFNGHAKYFKKIHSSPRQKEPYAAFFLIDLGEYPNFFLNALEKCE
jgi:hypothetical protein